MPPVGARRGDSTADFSHIKEFGGPLGIAPRRTTGEFEYEGENLDRKIDRRELSIPKSVMSGVCGLPYFVAFVQDGIEPRFVGLSPTTERDANVSQEHAPEGERFLHLLHNLRAIHQLEARVRLQVGTRPTKERYLRSGTDRIGPKRE